MVSETMTLNDEISKVIEKAQQLDKDERYGQAEAVIQESILEHPDSIELHIQHAIVLIHMSRDSKAENVLRSILEKDPSNEIASSLLGRLLDSSLRTDEAEKIFRDFLTNESRSHVIAEDLVHFLYGEERKDEALEFARKHAEEFPKDFHAYDALRYVLLKQEDALDSELIETDEKEDATTNLILNLIEQHTLLTKMLENINWQEKYDSGAKEEVEDHLHRVGLELLAISRELGDEIQINSDIIQHIDRITQRES